MTSQHPKKEPIIGVGGLRKNLGREITLYRWEQTPRNVQGTIQRDGHVFFVGDGERYPIENDQQIGMYTRGSQFSMRFYKVVL